MTSEQTEIALVDVIARTAQRAVAMGVSPAEVEQSLFAVGITAVLHRIGLARTREYLAHMALHILPED